jgi:hypothetical protein
MKSDLPAHRCCENCEFRMRSETSTTGFRCGYDYFKTAPLLRKFKTMGQYPVVRLFTTCELWSQLTSVANSDRSPD